MRRGTWGDDGDNASRRNNSWSSARSSSNHGSGDQERGLLSIAVEFLFGPSSGDDAGDSSSNLPLSSKELEKWKFRAAVIMTLSSESLGNGKANWIRCLTTDHAELRIESPISIPSIKANLSRRIIVHVVVPDDQIRITIEIKVKGATRPLSA